MALSRPRCYVASPLGFNEAGRSYYSTTYLPALAEIVEPVDPWSQLAEDAVQVALDNGTLRDLWLEVGLRNLELIRGCELLAAWLDGQEVDSGTAAEVGYAAGVGVTCFGLRSDLRQAGEEGMAVNLQVESSIVASGGVMAATLAELLEVLAVQVR